MTLELYADESKPNEVVPVVCVAGYVFPDDSARRFNDAWGAYLTKQGLPYFRMSERHSLQKKCGISETQMDWIARRLIKRLRHHTCVGLGVTVNVAAYEAAIARRKIVDDPHNRGMPSAYGFACYCLIMRVRRWMDRVGRDDDVAYFFESGEDSQGDADAWLKAVFANPISRERFHYAGHGFVPKIGHPTLQGGDMLAWHTAKMFRSEIEGREPRKDFEALIRPQDVRVDYTPEEITRTMTALEEAGLIGPAS